MCAHLLTDGFPKNFHFIFQVGRDDISYFVTSGSLGFAVLLLLLQREQANRRRERKVFLFASQASTIYSKHVHQNIEDGRSYRGVMEM